MKGKNLSEVIGARDYQVFVYNNISLSKIFAVLINAGLRNKSKKRESEVRSVRFNCSGSGLILMLLNRSLQSQLS